MTDKIFVPQIDVLLTDIIEGDETECISSKSFAASEKNADDEESAFELKPNPKIIYNLMTQDDWAQEINIETIRDDEDSQNVFRKIHVSNIPMNDGDNRRDRSLMLDVLYETGTTTRKIQYEIFQKALIYNVYIINCKYDIIIYNTCSLVKLFLYADENGSNMNKCYKYPVVPTIPTNERDITNEPDYAIIKSNLKTYNKNLTFKFGSNTVNIPVNNEDYHYLDFSINDYRTNIESTNPPVYLPGTRYNLYFKFNNTSNNIKIQNPFYWNTVNFSKIAKVEAIIDWSFQSFNNFLYFDISQLKISENNFLLNINNLTYSDLNLLYDKLIANGYTLNYDRKYIYMYLRTKIYRFFNDSNHPYSEDNDAFSVKIPVKFCLLNDDNTEADNTKLKLMADTDHTNNNYAKIISENNIDLVNKFNSKINGEHWHLFIIKDKNRNIFSYMFDQNLSEKNRCNSNFSINSTQPILPL